MLPVKPTILYSGPTRLVGIWIIAMVCLSVVCIGMLAPGKVPTNR